MASEKELFVTKQYVPKGQPLVQNDHVVIYNVRCMEEPGTPEALLKMYKHKNVLNIYQTLMQLDYTEWPHIHNVKYFDSNTLVVENYLKGNTLKELLEKNKARNVTYSEEAAYDIMTKICEAVDRLNSIQPPIVHTNLKPSNIFITNGGHVKFLDFEPMKTKKNYPFFDIIEILGKIFHEMLTGKEPKKSKSSYTGRYEKIIEKCLDPNPEKKYLNISDMKKDIEEAKEMEYTEPPVKVKIPYTLTYPFQFVILAFEWVLFAFFFRHNNNIAGLFGFAFVLHSIIYALIRHNFLNKNDVYLEASKRFLPILFFIAGLGLIYYLIGLIP